jgi:hypothetical protein
VGEPFWDAVRTMSLPDSLKATLETFRATGSMGLSSYEAFFEPSWLSVLLGQQVWPKDYDRRADALSLAELSHGLKLRRGAVRQAAEASPDATPSSSPATARRIRLRTPEIGREGGSKRCAKAFPSLANELSYLYE